MVEQFRDPSAERAAQKETGQIDLGREEVTRPPVQNTAISDRREQAIDQQIKETDKGRSPETLSSENVFLKPPETGKATASAWLTADQAELSRGVAPVRTRQLEIEGQMVKAVIQPAGENQYKLIAAGKEYLADAKALAAGAKDLKLRPVDNPDKALSARLQLIPKPELVPGEAKIDKAVSKAVDQVARLPEQAGGQRPDAAYLRDPQQFFKIWKEADPAQRAQMARDLVDNGLHTNKEFAQGIKDAAKAAGAEGKTIFDDIKKGIKDPESLLEGVRPKAEKVIEAGAEKLAEKISEKSPDKTVDKVLEKADKTVDKPGDATKTAADRVSDLLKDQKEKLEKATDAERAKAVLNELDKTARDLTRELGTDKRVKDLLDKSVEGGQKALDAAQKEASEFAAKVTPAQEAALRALQDKLEPKAQVLDELASKAQPALAVPEAAAGLKQPLEQAVRQVRPEDVAPRPEIKAADASPGALAQTAGGVFDGGGPLPTDLSAQAKQPQEVVGQQIQDALAGKGDLSEKEVAEKLRKKEEEEKEEAERKRREEEDAKRLADLAMLALKKKEQEEREEKERQEKQRQQEEQKREKYVVKEKDTLESIAAKMLRDKTLALLILEINKNAIPVKQQDGKKVIELKPKMTIWLPSPADIKQYRGRIGRPPAGEYLHVPAGDALPEKKLTPEEELAARFGGKPEDFRAEPTEKQGAADGRDKPQSGQAEVPAGQDLSAASLAATKTRREHMESLLGPMAYEAGGRLKYTVRLGDTLKSVAMRHPSLKDVQLWKLLAEINGLSTETDKRGTPAAALKRGSVIEIPTAEEIDSYRQRYKITPAAPKPISKLSEKADLATKPCPGCGRLTTASADSCGACGHSFVEAAGQGAKPGSVPGGEETVQPAAQTPSAVEEDALPFLRELEAPIKPAAPLEPEPSSPPPQEPSSLPPQERSSAPPQARSASAPAIESFEPVDDLTKHLFAAFDPAPSRPPEPEAHPEEAPAVVVSVEQRAVNNLVQDLSEHCRLMKSKDEGGLDAGVKTWLEVLNQGAWMPIVSYEIYDDLALRHEFTLDRRRKTIRIDLPPSAVQELADNDLGANWQTYYQKYIAGRPLSD